METLKERLVALLRKSEGIFKTDMVYLVKNGSWLGFAQIASTLLAFGMSLFFANAVSKDIYGNYKFIMAATGILGAISLSGLGTIVTQGVAQGHEGILKDAVKTSLRWGTLIVAAALTAAIYYFYKGNTTLGVSMLIAGATLPFMNAYSLFGNLQGGKKDFKGYAIYSTLGQVFTTVLLIIVAITTKSILALVATFFISSLIADIVSYRRVLSVFHMNEARDKSLIPYGKHISAMNLFGTVANSLDKLLVFHYLGAAELAIYSFAQALPEQIRGGFKSLFGITLPKYAAMSEKDMRTSIKNKTCMLTVIAALLALTYIVAAPFIFKFLFPKYTASVFYSQIYALGLVAYPGIALFGIYFQLKKATRTLYILNIFSDIVTIILTFVFIYKLGLKGAVVENGVSWLIMFLIYWYSFAKDKPGKTIPTDA
jgi:O-antigen/teichoic acid export membrane protein